MCTLGLHVRIHMSSNSIELIAILIKSGLQIALSGLMEELTQNLFVKPAVDAVARVALHPPELTVATS
jgi:ABC-type enterochelin transport system permease subunit